MSPYRRHAQTLSTEVLEELVGEGDEWERTGVLPEGSALEVEQRRAVPVESRPREVLPLMIFVYECWRELALRAKGPMPWR